MNICKLIFSYFLTHRFILIYAYGPFYGNRDLLCNRGTQFSCYCSIVTWRRFNRSDAPLCSELFPDFQAAILELATCDIRLEDNPYGHLASTYDNDDNGASTSFERYFKRTLATLIRRECGKSIDERCSKISSQLSEERIVFASYQCSKDLRTSRLWVILEASRDEAAPTPEVNRGPYEKAHFVDGASIARVLNSAAILENLNDHLSAKRSRILNVSHSNLNNAFKKTDHTSNRILEPTYTRLKNYDKPTSGYTDHIEDVDGRDNTSIEGSESTFNWVAVVVGCIFVGYFLVVWILALIFCLRKRREIQAKNRRLRGEEKNKIEEKGMQRPTNDSDPSTSQKLIARIDESDYDNK